MREPVPTSKLLPVTLTQPQPSPGGMELIGPWGWGSREQHGPPWMAQRVGGLLTPAAGLSSKTSIHPLLEVVTCQDKNTDSYYGTGYIVTGGSITRTGTTSRSGALVGHCRPPTGGEVMVYLVNSDWQR